MKIEENKNKIWKIYLQNRNKKKMLKIFENALNSK